MNIYNAIMKAADHIEENPLQFNFSSCIVPQSCGSPGCALGWIGFYLGCKIGETIESGFADERAKRVVARLGLECQTEFYSRMRDIPGSYAWRDSASVCARSMRLYAAKYHAPKLPDSVTAIFSQSIVHTKRQLEVMEAQP